MLSVFLALPVPHSLSVSQSFFSARPLSVSVVFHAVCLSRFSVPLSFSLSLYVSLSFFCPPSLCICLSLMPSVFLAFSVPHSLSVCQSVFFSARPLSESVCLSCRLSFSLSLSLTHPLSVCPFLCAPSLCICLSLMSSVFLALPVPHSLSTCQSVFYSARPLSASVCLSCRLSFSVSFPL